jgi:hypothetical protein
MNFFMRQPLLMTTPNIVRAEIAVISLYLRPIYSYKSRLMDYTLGFRQKGRLTNVT